MNDIESRIHRGINQMAPDVFQNVLADKSPKLESEVWLLKDQPSEKRNAWMRAARTAALLAACFMLIVGLGVYQMIFKVDSIVEIDVNPSLELQINRGDRVVRLNALNADGVKILDDVEENLKHTKLDDAVRILVNEMVEDGYLDQESSSVLISVSHGNETRSTELQLMVADNVKETLKQDEIKGVVYHQSYETTDTISELSLRYDISPGKACFIQKLILKRPDFTVEELAKLSISEITRLLEEESVDVSEYTAKRPSSQKIHEESEDTQDTSEGTWLVKNDTEDSEIIKTDHKIEPGQTMYDQEDSLENSAAGSEEAIDGEVTNEVTEDTAWQNPCTGQNGTEPQTPEQIPDQDNLDGNSQKPGVEEPGQTTGDTAQDGSTADGTAEEVPGGSVGMGSSDETGSPSQWEDVTGIPEPLYGEINQLISVTDELLANISNMEPLEQAGGSQYAYETCRNLLVRGSSQYNTVHSLAEDMRKNGSLTGECDYRISQILKTAETKQKAVSDFLEFYGKSNGVLQ